MAQTQQGGRTPMSRVLLRWSVSDRLAISVVCLSAGAAAWAALGLAGAKPWTASTAGMIVTAAVGLVALLLHQKVSVGLLGQVGYEPRPTAAQWIFLGLVAPVSLSIAHVTGTFPMPGILLGALASSATYWCVRAAALHLGASWARQEVEHERRRARAACEFLGSNHKAGAV